MDFFIECWRAKGADAEQEGRNGRRNFSGKKNVNSYSYPHSKGEGLECSMLPLPRRENPTRESIPNGGGRVIYTKLTLISAR